MIGVPASRRLLGASCAAARLAASVLVPRASFSSRGIAFSTVCRSARISSVWMVEMSLAGLTSPSTWVTSSSRKTRVTWQIAADSRMWERNLLPRPSPSRRAAHDAGDVDELDGRGQDLGRLEDLGEPRQPVVGHADDADVGLDRRERVVRREDVVLGQRVEEGRLARVGESDDADGECHGRRVYGGAGAARISAQRFSRATSPSSPLAQQDPSCVHCTASKCRSSKAVQVRPPS